jgi:pimeloyl-ACP methyl ester carboxylesterase
MIDHVPSLVVLVGHSSGCTLIARTGIRDRVGALVFIAAFALVENETSQGQQDQFSRTPVFDHIEVAGGRIWLKPSGVPYFCGDLPEVEQTLVLATGAVPDADLFNQQAPGVA